MPSLAELSTLEPKKLHAWAKRFNWDDELLGPTLTLRNRRCALATALLLYWRAKPHFYRQWRARKDVPAEEREAFDLLRAIEKALRAGAFAPRGIAYDPRDDLDNDFTAIDYPKEAKVRDLPPEVLVWTDGKKAYPLAPAARATTAKAKQPSRGTPARGTPSRGVPSRGMEVAKKPGAKTTAKKRPATKNTPTPTKPATARARKNATKKAAVRAAPQKPTAEKPTAKKTADKATANETTKKPTARQPTAKKETTRKPTAKKIDWAALYAPTARSRTKRTPMT